ATRLRQHFANSSHCRRWQLPRTVNSFGSTCLIAGCQYSVAIKSTRRGRDAFDMVCCEFASTPDGNPIQHCHPRHSTTRYGGVQVEQHVIEDQQPNRFHASRTVGSIDRGEVSAANNDVGRSLALKAGNVDSSSPKSRAPLCQYEAIHVAMKCAQTW